MDWVNFKRINSYNLELLQCHQLWTKHLVAHTRGYKFISIRSHHMKEVEKTKSNVSAIVWTPSVTSRPICRWLKPQTNMPNWKKRKPLWKQKLLACAKFTARNSVRKHRSWWRCRSSARLLKRASWYGQTEEERSRTGRCAPNDRAGPRNGPTRDDRVL